MCFKTERGIKMSKDKRFFKKRQQWWKKLTSKAFIKKLRI